MRAFAASGGLRTLLAASAALLLAFFARALLLDVLGILFGASLLGFLFAPLARLLEKKLSRPLSALLAMLAALLLLLLALYFLLPALIAQISGLIGLLPEAFGRIRALSERVGTWLRESLPGISLPGVNFSGAESGLSGFARSTIAYAGNLFDGIYRLSLMVVLSYFLLTQRDQVLLRLELMLPSRWRKTTVRMGNGVVRELRLYMRGQATIALAVGILAVAALLALGVQGAVLLGLFVGLLNMIPYFGPVLGGIPAVISALGSGWQKAAFTVLALFLVQQIDGLVISPRVMGSVSGFSPGVVLLALYIGSKIAGVWGMILAMPALMSIRTLYRVFVQRRENN